MHDLLLRLQLAQGCAPEHYRLLLALMERRHSTRDNGARIGSSPDPWRFRYRERTLRWLAAQRWQRDRLRLPSNGPSIGGFMAQLPCTFMRMRGVTGIARLCAGIQIKLSLWLAIRSIRISALSRSNITGCRTLVAVEIVLSGLNPSNSL